MYLSPTYPTGPYTILELQGRVLWSTENIRQIWKLQNWERVCREGCYFRKRLVSSFMPEKFLETFFSCKFQKNCKDHFAKHLSLADKSTDVATVAFNYRLQENCLHFLGPLRPRIHGQILSKFQPNLASEQNNSPFASSKVKHQMSATMGYLRLSNQAVLAHNVWFKIK